MKELSGYIIPVQEMKSPWEAADENYPGGFKQYFKDMFCN